MVFPFPPFSPASFFLSPPTAHTLFDLGKDLRLKVMTKACNGLHFHEASKEKCFISSAHTYEEPTLWEAPPFPISMSQENRRGEGGLLLCGKNQRDGCTEMGCVKSSTPAPCLNGRTCPLNQEGSSIGRDTLASPRVLCPQFI